MYRGLKLVGYRVEGIEEFKYLGLIITSKNEKVFDINESLMGGH